jgi:hypothetical protein
MRNVAFAAALLLLGAGCGYLVARNVESKGDLATEVVTCETANTGTTLMVLRGFRTGTPTDQIISLLEASLSLHVVTLDGWLRELQPLDPTSAEKLLRGIADYRSEYPFSSANPEADRIVEAVLASYSSE